jgi:hypothetical protein
VVDWWSGLLGWGAGAVWELDWARIWPKFGLNGLFGSLRYTPEFSEYNSGFYSWHLNEHSIFRVLGNSGSRSGNSVRGSGFMPTVIPSNGTSPWTWACGLHFSYSLED